jgi:Asp-tRNA(Asn)/Glu-tRNA(Gln) amidotransferase A subunit family amidase
MTPAGLPDSIAGLRAMLERGDVTVEESLSWQRSVFASDTHHAHVALLRAMPAPHVSQSLAGVGLAHKDIFVLAQRVPQCGTFEPWRAASCSPATVVQRINTQGGFPLASLAMAAHACGATGENANFPLPVNPVDHHAAVGGSSSGSAVAVAAGLCYASLGTDTAGSVRIPAATCGVLGLKTTRGLLPTDGVAPLAPSLDTVGVLARSAADAYAIFRTALTDDQRIATSEFRDAANERSWNIVTCWIHPDAAAVADESATSALENFARHCSARGHRREVALENLLEWMQLAQTILYAEASHSHVEALRGMAPAIPQLVRTIALAGAAMPVQWYERAHSVRDAHTHSYIADVLGDSDVLLTPALPRGVPNWTQVQTSSQQFESRQLLDLFCWMTFVNYLGLPAVVFPIGIDAKRRPVCVQAIGRPGTETMLLSLARDTESSFFERSTHFDQTALVVP